MSASVQALFQPFELGGLRLPTRVVMAPMTRSFSPNGAAGQYEGLLERLHRGEFDLVPVGRALLVDADWAVKVKEGRMGDILPFSREALKTLA